MKKAISHFKKLLECEQFIVTGSYSFYLLGLINRVTDLDIILVNPTEETRKILERLKVETKSEYPGGNQIRVKYENMNIDFFSQASEVKCLNVNGIEIAYPKDTVKAKKQYQSLKHIIQLKGISELFFKPSDLVEAVKLEQAKLNPKTTSDGFDLDDILEQNKPPKPSKK